MNGFVWIDKIIVVLDGKIVRWVEEFWSFFEFFFGSEGDEYDEV